MTFRKRPLTVKAYKNPEPKPYFVDTLEGKVLTNEGDMLIVGLNDEVYPCRAEDFEALYEHVNGCLLYTSPSPRDRQKSRMPSSA